MQRRGYLWEKQSYPLMQQCAVAVMGWAGWESCLPTLPTSVVTCAHSAHQLPDIRQVPTFHNCSDNFPTLTLIKWKWGRHMAQRNHREPPPISCQQYQWTKPFLTSIYPALLKLPWCRTAASRLWCFPPFSAAKFLTKIWPTFSLLQLTALYPTHSRQITGYSFSPAGIYTFQGHRAQPRDPTPASIISTCCPTSYFLNYVVIFV